MWLWIQSNDGFRRSSIEINSKQWNNGNQRPTWFKSLMVHKFSNLSNVLFQVYWKINYRMNVWFSWTSFYNWFFSTPDEERLKRWKICVPLKTWTNLCVWVCVCVCIYIYIYSSRREFQLVVECSIREVEQIMIRRKTTSQRSDFKFHVWTIIRLQILHLHEIPPTKFNMYGAKWTAKLSLFFTKYNFAFYMKAFMHLIPRGLHAMRNYL